MPQVDAITSSSAVVSWPKANDIPPGLEAYYYYVVWLQADGVTERKVAQIVQHANGNKLGSPIPGLMFNTHYSVKIEPYRQNSETHEGGSTTNVATFKTSCIGKLAVEYLCPSNRLFLVNSVSNYLDIDIKKSATIT